jgi:hypothetical protein
VLRLALVTVLLAAAPAHAIYRGAVVPPEQTPWFVTFSSRGISACGGALVAPDRVVTAAHCVTGRDPAKLRMRIGGGSLKAARLFPAGKAITFPPTYEEILPRPDAPPMEAATLDDVAIVTLARPVRDVAPLVVAAAAPAAGETAITYGRGRTRSIRRGDMQAPVSDRVLSTTQTVVAPEDCERTYGRLHDAVRHLCTIDAPGRSKACAGDSGGPIVVAREDELQLVAVVTWGDETKGFDCEGGGFADVGERLLAHPDLLGAGALPAAPFAQRRVRVRTSGDIARCVIGEWGGAKATFRVRWFRAGRLRIRNGEVTLGRDRFLPGATGRTIHRRRGPLYCEVTASSAGGIAVERSYNGAWPPPRSRHAVMKLKGRSH